jgi:5'-methylthioadenosine phosphorylase
MSVALIGGTGISQITDLTDVHDETVETKFGAAHVTRGNLRGRELLFLHRHGPQRNVPPHRINYRANIAALKQLGVTAILATAAVGGLHDDWPPGTLVLLDQFLDFTKLRPTTFFDGGEVAPTSCRQTSGAMPVHIDMTEPYCPRLRRLLLNIAEQMNVTLIPQGVYACMEGPRFETPAEIRMLRMLGGDVVGMTGVPEVVLAREAGICYAGVAIVTNYAAGISPAPLTHEEVMDAMAEHAPKLLRLFLAAVEVYEDAPCACRQTVLEP